MSTGSLFNEKPCRKCNRLLPHVSFHKTSSSKDGFREICKECVSEYHRYLKLNPPPADRKVVKRCPKCETTKPRSEFGVRCSGKYSKSYCKDCENSDTAKKYHANKDVARAINRRTTLRRYYGITEDIYTRMLVSQKGGCAVCGVPEPNGKKQYLCVDHDHATGAIRGLLCIRCNAAVGYIRDNPDIAANISEYLTTHKSAENPMIINPGHHVGHKPKVKEKQSVYQENSQPQEGAPGPRDRVD